MIIEKYIEFLKGQDGGFKNERMYLRHILMHSKSFIVRPKWLEGPGLPDSIRLKPKFNAGRLTNTTTVIIGGLYELKSKSKKGYMQNVYPNEKKTFEKLLKTSRSLIEEICLRIQFLNMKEGERLFELPSFYNIFDRLDAGLTLNDIEYEVMQRFCGHQDPVVYIILDPPDGKPSELGDSLIMGRVFHKASFYSQTAVHNTKVVWSHDQPTLYDQIKRDISETDREIAISDPPSLYVRYENGGIKSAEVMNKWQAHQKYMNEGISPQNFEIESMVFQIPNCKVMGGMITHLCETQDWEVLKEYLPDLTIRDLYDSTLSITI